MHCFAILCSSNNVPYFFFLINHCSLSLLAFGRLINVKSQYELQLQHIGIFLMSDFPTKCCLYGNDGWPQEEVVVEGAIISTTHVPNFIPDEKDRQYDGGIYNRLICDPCIIPNGCSMMFANVSKFTIILALVLPLLFCVLCIVMIERVFYC